ncbi:MAG TPA: murein transglycosylase A [Stellaceae bacterium]|nr:murein transglycosylase A [Stellaceae bacterium]
MPSLKRLIAVLAAFILLAGCASVETGSFNAPARVSLTRVGFQQLPGWSGDAVAAAIPAFVKSCQRMAAGPDDYPLDAATGTGDFGRLRDWRPLCAAAARVPPGDDGAARQFFEANFVPALVGAKDIKGASDGLFTGYWEVELDGSLRPQGRYQTPVYRKPADLAGQPYLDRAAIETGAPQGRGLEVVWLQSPDDLLVLQTQGSGRIHLADGGMMRLVYDANNNRPVVSVYQLLKDSGAIPPAQFNEAAVRAWMRDNPDKAAAIRRKNPSYVFFRRLNGDGPVGFEGAVLTPERSLAIDHRFLPLGAPIWLAASGKYRPVALNRLVVAQDTGDGIDGPLRGDFYWGSGVGAAARGADFYAGGQYWVLLPRTVAARN